MLQDIIAVPAFRDNYIWLIVQQSSREVVIVDPGDADVVIQAVAQYDLNPCCILITHHHWDHTGGVQKLKNHFRLKVYGPNNPKITDIDYALTEEDGVDLPAVSRQFSIMTTPGHTLDHIVYFNNDELFCGDTLFSGGCGRLFEGSAEQLHHSLTRLAALPSHTKVYCTHEYTLANLNFARSVEPDNEKLHACYKQVKDKRDQQQPTLPSSIGLECQINPFLRCHLPSVRSAAETYAQKSLTTPVAVFAALRLWKDNFTT